MMLHRWASIPYVPRIFPSSEIDPACFLLTFYRFLNNNNNNDDTDDDDDNNNNRVNIYLNYLFLNYILSGDADNIVRNMITCIFCIEWWHLLLHPHLPM